MGHLILSVFTGSVTQVVVGSFLYIKVNHLSCWLVGLVPLRGQREREFESYNFKLCLLCQCA